MDRLTTRSRRNRWSRWGLGILMLAGVGCSAESALAQATNQITSISPSSAAQGTAGLVLTFNLDTDMPPAPPAGVMPDSVLIGSISGTSVTHSSQYVVTAVFDIPGSEPTGPKDATVNFTTPQGSLVFSMAGGFTVTAGADTPPSITQHPQSQTAPPGSSVTFTVVASGTEPLEYQWQKDEVDISGATESSYTINPVDWGDAGNYRCVVTNDFGTATSDEAVLTVAELQIGAYPVVDTAQDVCYDEQFQITCPSVGDAFYGQDAQYFGNQPSYAISGDGLTVYDNVTGLTWTRDADLDGDGDIDVDDKVTFDEGQLVPDTLNAQNYGGYSDWRVPSIKELYSLIDFRGTDPTSFDTTEGFIPFIDTDYFYFAYGDIAAGERSIDSQWLTSTLYVSTVMDGQQAMFGVNFADGRIKGYGLSNPEGGEKTFYVRLCRGNTDYGVNNFTDNADGTITDEATGLMWEQGDSSAGMNWEDALAWVELMNNQDYLGYNDWRLPNAKELQSIVDYTRSPDTSASAAIDPVFNATQITNVAGQADYPFYWTGTTHIRGVEGSGQAGAYVAFGRGLGSMDGVNVIDVHGAGCQRSDPKDGDPNDYPSWGNGPQGDLQRVFNYVRLVRDADLAAPYDGYNLFTSLNSTTAYLMDMDGNFVHSWETGYRPGQAMYFLENGELLHTGNVNNMNFNVGGAGGMVQTFDWDGNVTWAYEYSSAEHLQHHDIEMLPNGNVLMVAWQYKSQAEAIAAGRNPALLSEGELWPDSVIEVASAGPTTGDIVWEWHAWDHLVQDYDPSQENYGVVADHPELIDLNYTLNPGADWNHVNSVDYNADLDQIILSVHNFGEVWVIDHSTTTVEAAGHSGGDSGMGGDLLYRWGNPPTYGAGAAGDQQLFGQHDAEWIETGLPGEGNILIFNNGQGRPGGNYSSVDEIVPPVTPDGSYTLVPGSAYGPDAPTWSYTADPPTDFFAQNISGQQRLPNGNTLICEGPSAYFFEVTSAGDTVWDYTYTGSVFRVERYPAEYPGFDGTPLDDEAECSGDGDCDDGVACTDDTCEGTVCVYTPNDANCPDDGLYCNGVETCSVTLGCQSEPAPCPAESCNEISDVCEVDCTPPDPPLPDFAAKNRYLSVEISDTTQAQGVQVTFISLPGYEYAEGRSMWVHPPHEMTEASGSSGSTPPPVCTVAELGCTPYYTVWGDVGVVDLYDAAIVPGATIELRAITEGCDTANPTNYSSPLIVVMSDVGDVVGDCEVTPCSPPQGVVDFVDISSIVEKFKNTPSAPRKARVDLINSDVANPLPDGKVDFVDISYCVEAFRSTAFPLPGPPAEDPCPHR